MIDWAASGLSLETVSCRKKVIIVCEVCGRRRSVAYANAKHKTTHHCQKCSQNSGASNTSRLTLHTCIECGISKLRTYRKDQSEEWHCHKCAMKKAHRDGKIHSVAENLCTPFTSAQASEIAKASWLSDEYRAKQMQSRALTKDHRSAKSKEIWSDQKRLENLSDKIKLKWQDIEYRSIKERQSRELWLNDEYRTKQLNGMNRPETKLAMSEARSAQQHRISSIQKTLYALLDDLGVSFQPEAPIGYYVFDCLIDRRSPQKRLLIECQGDYWHTIPGSSAKDRAKFTYIQRYFPDYEIMYLWEHGFSTKDRVLERLKYKLGLSTETINFDFSDLRVCTPNNAQLSEFLEAYHYIGKGRGGKAVAAYLGDKLIAVIVFSAPLRQNTISQFGTKSACELSRLCIHPQYQKKNLASWFIAKALKSVDTDIVYSYSDSTYAHSGTVYKASGFTQHHIVAPDYWYVDRDGYVMHKLTLYRQARRMSMTEREFAASRGYSKCYGGPKICWVKANTRVWSNSKTQPDQG